MKLTIQDPDKTEALLQPALQTFQTFIKINDESQINHIVDSLTSIDFFRKNCPDGSNLKDFIVYASKALKYEQYTQGQIIFHYGDYGDKFFMILKGQVAVLVPKAPNEIQEDRDLLLDATDWSTIWKGKKTQSAIDAELLLAQGEDPWLLSNRYFEGGVCLYQKIYTYSSGQTFGDVSLYSDRPRTASILVTSDELHVITMNKSEYKLICERSLQDFNSNVDYFMRMLPNNSKFVITKFMQYMQKTEFAPQTILWKEGEEPRFFMLIVKGRIELIRKINNVRITLCQLSDNAFVGQQEILDQTLRFSSCQCADNTLAYHISVEEFNSIKRNFPEICKILKEKSQLLKDYMKTRQEMILENFINKPQIRQSSTHRGQKNTLHEFFQKTVITDDIRSHSPKILTIQQITESNHKILKDQQKHLNLNIFPQDKEIVLTLRERVCRQLIKQNKKKERVQPQIKEGTVLSNRISEILKNDTQRPKTTTSFSFLNLYAQGSTSFINTNNSDHFTSRLTTQQSYFRLKTEQATNKTHPQLQNDCKTQKIPQFIEIQFIMNLVERRNKTNPDQHQLLSMSTQSSARNSAVKATIKVYSEMQEDQSCKLAMRFTQLKIVLATHKIVSSLHKFKSIRLQHYFDLLQVNKQQHTIRPQFLTPPTKKKSVKFQSRYGLAQILVLRNVLNKQIQKHFLRLRRNENNRRQKFQEFSQRLTNLIDAHKYKCFTKLKCISQSFKAIRKLNLIITQKQTHIQLESLIHMVKYTHINVINSQQLSVLDSMVSQGFENQMMSAKEQLAMKFASTSLLIGILSQIMIKAQFAFLLHLRAGQLQRVDVRELKSIDISENFEQSLIEEDRIKPKIIAANQIMNLITSKLKEYFVALQNPPHMYSSNILESEIITKKSKPNLKLFLLGQKVFKEDEHQQKSTDITMNEKKRQVTLPGVRYVTQYSDLSKNLLSDSDVTVKSSDHVTQTSIIMNKLKKEKLNSAIQKYLSPTQIQKTPKIPQKPKVIAPVKSKFSKKLYLLLPILLLIFLALLKS